MKKISVALMFIITTFMFGGTITTDSNGKYIYEDNQIKVTINCVTDAGNIEQIEKKINQTSKTLLVGDGFYWAGTPINMPDATQEGLAQVHVYSGQEPGAQCSIQYLNNAIRVNWVQSNVHKYNDPNKTLGIAAYGSYTFPYETSRILVWNRFLINDISQFSSEYNTTRLSSFYSSLDINTEFTKIIWPTNLNRYENNLESSYSIIGGDWRRPSTSWDASTKGCTGSDNYLAYDYYTLFNANVKDGSCFFDSSEVFPNNAILGTTVNATKINNASYIPYMMHYAPAQTTNESIGIVRVLTSNADRRATIQVFDNAEYLGDTTYSSNISWDWGDLNYELQPYSNFSAPQLQNGWEQNTNEEIWIGNGTVDQIRNWVKGIHNIH